MVFTQDELAIIMDSLERQTAELSRMALLARNYGCKSYAGKLDNFALECIHVHAKVRDLFNEEVCIYAK